MDITAQNTFTPAVYKSDGQGVAVSVSGTFVANVVIQRSKDGASWIDIETVTAAAERDARSATAWYWRAGVKTGGYTSGTAVVNVY